LSNDTVISNHVFMGNTRVASIVKHKDEQQPATYYYASDHLGSSSVLTNNTGSYHERIEYLPYGEVWLEDTANTNYSTPYKFTGKELDKETGLYYYGARYYDAMISRWISTDPALVLYISGKPNGGVYNSINIDLYKYGNNNPIRYYDPDGYADKDGWEAFKYVDRLPWGEDPKRYKDDNANNNSPINDSNQNSTARAEEKVEETKKGVINIQQNSNEKQKAGSVLEVVPSGVGRITSPYGNRKHPKTGKEHFHTGTDVAAPEGTPILSLTKGKVESIANKNGYGNQVGVQSDNGDIVTYSHIQDGSIRVKVGDEVSVGDHIAGVGDTGTATGYHVHVEVILPSGRKENPEDYFK